MIKNLEKDLRIYRKDTFITSFFATITILLIVLIICSVPSHAQEISGTGYSYNDSDMNNIREYYDIDFNATNPTGLLCYDLNSNFHKINGNIYNSSGYMFYNKNDASYNQYLQFLSDTNQTMMPSKFKYQGVTYNLSDYPYFVIISSYANCNRVVVSKDSQFYCNNNTNEICQFYNDHPDTFVFEWAVGDTQGNPSIYRVTSKSNITINGVTREYLTYSNGYNFYLIYTNTSVKANEYSYSNNTYNYLNQDMELNYLLGQSGNGGVSNDTGSESPNNNLVMSNGDWTFKNDRYTAPYDENFPTGSIYPNGSISFSFNPTEYQISNPSAFELVFTFYFKYDVNYKNLHQAFSVFETTSSFLNNTKRYAHTYNYNDNGAVEIEVPLSEFISNGNSKSWTWSDIFDKLENGALSSVLSNSREVTSISYNKFDLTATAYIKSSTDKSGSITEWYNPMNKKGYTTDDSGSLNKNPYVPSASEDPDSSNSQNPEGNAPGEGGNNGNGESSSISNGGNVTVYNYNTNNNNNSLSNDGNTFNDIFTSMIGNNKVTSESLADTTGTNGFLSFMNNTLTGVPALFFTNLLNFFITCLAILIVAFVLRMLLDIL